jgi:MFS family permease
MMGLFFFGGIAFLLGAVVIFVIAREVPHTTNSLESQENQPGSHSSPKSGWRVHIRILVILAAAVAIGSLGVNAFAYFFGVYLVSEIGGSPLMVGIGNGVASLLGLGVTLAAGHGSDRIGRKPVILLGFIGYAIFMLVYLFVVDPWIAMYLWFIPLYPLISTASYASAADISKIKERGRAMSTIATANSLGAAFGPIIGGALVQFIFLTLRVNLIFAMVMSIVAFCVVLFFVPETLRRKA